MTSSASSTNTDAVLAAALLGPPVTIHYAKAAQIIVPVDRAEKCAMELDRRIRRGYYWFGPAGLALTAFGTWSTASGFRPDRGLSPDVWEALFILVGVLFGALTLVALVPAILHLFPKYNPLNRFIAALRGDSQLVLDPLASGTSLTATVFPHPVSLPPEVPPPSSVS